MTDTTFISGETIIPADWANDVNRFTYSATDKAAAKALTIKDGLNIFIKSSDGKGNAWRGVTGAAPGTYSEDGGSFAGTVILPTGGDGSSAWLRDYEGLANAAWFGVSAASVDNATAFNAAALSGKPIYISGGIYLISSEINFTLNNTTFTGEGKRLVTIKVGASQTINSGMILIASGVSGVSISGIGFDGDSDNNTTANYSAIYATSPQDIEIFDNLIRNTPKNGIQLAATTTSCNNFSIEKNELLNIGWIGIRVEFAIGGSISRNSVKSSGSTCISIGYGTSAATNGSSNILVQGNKVLDKSIPPTTIYLGAAETGFFISMASGVSNITVDSNICYDNRNSLFDGIGYGQDGINTVTGIIITNNQVRFAGGFGIDVTDTCTCIGNIVENSGSHGIVIVNDLGGDMKNITLSDNVIKNSNEKNVAGVAGIYVNSLIAGAEFDNIIINDNVVIEDRATKRVQVQIWLLSTNVTFTDVQIKDNICKGFTGLPISVSGSAFSGINIKGNIGDEHTVSSPAPAANFWGRTKINSASNAVNATLGDGQYIGEEKIIVLSDASNVSTLTIAKHETSSPEVATFTNINDYLKLMWTGSLWATVSGNATF